MTSDGSDTIEEFALVTKGKDCVAIVESVCSDLTKGCVNGVEQQLKGLENDADELAKHAEYEADKIEEKEQEHIQEIEGIQRQIGYLGRQKEELQQHKRELDNTLSNKQYLLSQASNDLQCRDKAKKC